MKSNKVKLTATNGQFATKFPHKYKTLYSRINSGLSTVNQFKTLYNSTFPTATTASNSPLNAMERFQTITQADCNPFISNALSLISSSSISLHNTTSLFFQEGPLVLQSMGKMYDDAQAQLKSVEAHISICRDQLQYALKILYKRKCDVYFQLNQLCSHLRTLDHNSNAQKRTTHQFFVKYQLSVHSYLSWLDNVRKLKALLHLDKNHLNTLEDIEKKRISTTLSTLRQYSALLYHVQVEIQQNLNRINLLVQNTRVNRSFDALVDSWVREFGPTPVQPQLTLGNNGIGNQLNHNQHNQGLIKNTPTLTSTSSSKQLTASISSTDLVVNSLTLFESYKIDPENLLHNTNKLGVPCQLPTNLLPQSTTMIQSTISSFPSHPIDNHKSPTALTQKQQTATANPNYDFQLLSNILQFARSPDFTEGNLLTIANDPMAQLSNISTTTSQTNPPHHLFSNLYTYSSNHDDIRYVTAMKRRFGLINSIGICSLKQVYALSYLLYSCCKPCSNSFIEMIQSNGIDTTLHRFYFLKLARQTASGNADTTSELKSIQDAFYIDFLNWRSNESQPFGGIALFATQEQTNCVVCDACSKNAYKDMEETEDSSDGEELLQLGQSQFIYPNTPSTTTSMKSSVSSIDKCDDLYNYDLLPTRSSLPCHSYQNGDPSASSYTCGTADNIYDPNCDDVVFQDWLQKLRVDLSRKEREANPPVAPALSVPSQQSMTSQNAQTSQPPPTLLSQSSIISVDLSSLPKYAESQTSQSNFDQRKLSQPSVQPLHSASIPPLCFPSPSMMLGVTNFPAQTSLPTLDLLQKNLSLQPLLGTPHSNITTDTTALKFTPRITTTHQTSDLLFSTPTPNQSNLIHQISQNALIPLSTPSQSQSQTGANLGIDMNNLPANLAGLVDPSLFANPWLTTPTPQATPVTTALTNYTPLQPQAQRTTSAFVPPSPEISVTNHLPAFLQPISSTTPTPISTPNPPTATRPVSTVPSTITPLQLPPKLPPSSISSISSASTSTSLFKTPSQSIISSSSSSFSNNNGAAQKSAPVESQLYSSSLKQSLNTRFDSFSPIISKDGNSSAHSLQTAIANSTQMFTLLQPTLPANAIQSLQPISTPNQANPIQGREHRSKSLPSPFAPNPAIPEPSDDKLLQFEFQTPALFDITTSLNMMQNVASGNNLSTPILKTPPKISQNPTNKTPQSRPQSSAVDDSVLFVPLLSTSSPHLRRFSADCRPPNDGKAHNTVAQTSLSPAGSDMNHFSIEEDVVKVVVNKIAAQQCESHNIQTKPQHEQNRADQSKVTKPQTGGLDYEIDPNLVFISQNRRMSICASTAPAQTIGSQTVDSQFGNQTINSQVDSDGTLLNSGQPDQSYDMSTPVENRARVNSFESGNSDILNASNSFKPLLISSPTHKSVTMTTSSGRDSGSMIEVDLELIKQQQYIDRVATLEKELLVIYHKRNNQSSFEDIPNAETTPPHTPSQIQDLAHLISTQLSSQPQSYIRYLCDSFARANRGQGTGLAQGQQHQYQQDFAFLSQLQVILSQSNPQQNSTDSNDSPQVPPSNKHIDKPTASTASSNHPTAAAPNLTVANSFCNLPQPKPPAQTIPSTAQSTPVQKPLNNNNDAIYTNTIAHSPFCLDSSTSQDDLLNQINLILQQEDTSTKSGSANSTTDVLPPTISHFPAPLIRQNRLQSAQSPHPAQNPSQPPKTPQIAHLPSPFVPISPTPVHLPPKVPDLPLPDLPPVQLSNVASPNTGYNPPQEPQNLYQLQRPQSPSSHPHFPHRFSNHYPHAVQLAPTLSSNASPHNHYAFDIESGTQSSEFSVGMQSYGQVFYPTLQFIQTQPVHNTANPDNCPNGFGQQYGIPTHPSGAPQHYQCYDYDYDVNIRSKRPFMHEHGNGTNIAHNQAFPSNFHLSTQHHYTPNQPACFNYPPTGNVQSFVGLSGSEGFSQLSQIDPSNNIPAFQPQNGNANSLQNHPSWDMYSPYQPLTPYNQHAGIMSFRYPPQPASAIQQPSHVHKPPEPYRSPQLHFKYPQPSASLQSQPQTKMSSQSYSSALIPVIDYTTSLTRHTSSVLRHKAHQFKPNVSSALNDRFFDPSHGNCSPGRGTSLSSPAGSSKVIEDSPNTRTPITQLQYNTPSTKPTTLPIPTLFEGDENAHAQAMDGTPLAQNVPNTTHSHHFASSSHKSRQKAHFQDANVPECTSGHHPRSVPNGGQTQPFSPIDNVPTSFHHTASPPVHTEKRLKRRDIKRELRRIKLNLAKHSLGKYPNPKQQTAPFQVNVHAGNSPPLQKPDNHPKLDDPTFKPQSWHFSEQRESCASGITSDDDYFDVLARESQLNIPILVDNEFYQPSVHSSKPRVSFNHCTTSCDVNGDTDYTHNNTPLGDEHDSNKHRDNSTNLSLSRCITSVISSSPASSHADSNQSFDPNHPADQEGMQTHFSAKTTTLTNPSAKPRSAHTSMNHSDLHTPMIAPSHSLSPLQPTSSSSKRLSSNLMDRYAQLSINLAQIDGSDSASNVKPILDDDDESAAVSRTKQLQLDMYYNITHPSASVLSWSSASSESFHLEPYQYDPEVSISDRPESHKALTSPVQNQFKLDHPHDSAMLTAINSDNTNNQINLKSSYHHQRTTSTQKSPFTPHAHTNVGPQHKAHTLNLTMAKEYGQMIIQHKVASQPPPLSVKLPASPARSPLQTPHSTSPQSFDSSGSTPLHRLQTRNSLLLNNADTLDADTPNAIARNTPHSPQQIATSHFNSDTNPLANIYQRFQTKQLDDDNA